MSFRIPAANHALKLVQRKFENGISMYYRAGTSDENVIKEVIDKHAYRRKKIGFDVLPGERWLDLGANIGAFAVYCRLRGAIAECYEPDPECFKILRKNAPGFKLHQQVVTGLRNITLGFYTNNNPNDFYRGTVLAAKRMHKYIEVQNVHGSSLTRMKFDGVKMDIEGSEGLLLDEWLMPRCSKLVLEYHSSRDSDMANFARRVKMLRKHFKFVKYPSELDKAIAAGVKNYKPFVDRNIFCWSPK